MLEIFFECIVDFIMELIVGAIDESTKKYKKTVRNTIITVFALSVCAFFISLPFLLEANGNRVLGIVLFSLLPLELIAAIVVFVVGKIKKKNK
ncbi:MAG: hypothetical protein IKC01_08655 [Clostridia bacterium]|nr:hypothetical protein [Clostridia bacterium]